MVSCICKSSTDTASGRNCKDLQPIRETKHRIKTTFRNSVMVTAELPSGQSSLASTKLFLKTFWSPHGSTVSPVPFSLRSSCMLSPTRRRSETKIRRVVGRVGTETNAVWTSVWSYRVSGDLKERKGSRVCRAWMGWMPPVLWYGARTTSPSMHFI